MTSELYHANNGLEIALDEYLEACQTFQNSNLNATPKPQGSVDPVPRVITSEYRRIALLEKKMRHVKETLEISRGGSSIVTPINTLPVEVLTRVFWLVTKSKPCKLDPWSLKYGGLLKYPVLLTHVCPYWRQIIIDSPLFWSHIDAIPLMCTDETVKTRIQTFVTRAGYSTLDIHISMPYPTDEHWESFGLSEFLGPLVPRIRSLDVEIIMDDDIEDYEVQPPALDFCASILSVCLGPGSVPGILTEVNLRIDTLIRCLFLEGAEGGRRDENYLSIDVPTHHLESIWRYVTILNLGGIFPFWSSVAYSGLVELRLDGNSYINDKTISECQLASILSSSPQLRTLIISLSIVPAGTPCVPVLLSSLDTLVLHPEATHNLECVMRLLIPGLKPLHTTIGGIARDLGEKNTITEAAKFFSRSNLTTLHVVDIDNFSRLLGSVDTIQGLGITISAREDAESLLACEKPPNLYPRRLHIFSRSSFSFSFHLLSQLVQMYTPRQLFLRGLYRIDRDGVHLTKADDIEQGLSNFGFTTEVILLELPGFKDEPFLSF
ncbi:hypothetical protein RhiTH_006482 [Rhizoctonia solani]